MVRIDRGSGKPVFGGWPTEDPKSGVIWEAFKPESEPRRVVRRDEVAKPKEAKPVQRRQGQPESDFLQRQGGIY